MTKLFARFRKDESGATAIEYGLIAALIALGVIGGATYIGQQVNTKFNTIGSKINTAGNTSQSGPTTP